MVEKRWNLFPMDTLIQYEEKGKSIAQIVADNGAMLKGRQTRGTKLTLYSSHDPHAPGVQKTAVWLSRYFRPSVIHSKGWGYFRDLEYEMVAKVSGMPQWALIDAGGGVVVDLDSSGNEVYSERKVAKLRESCAIVYVRVRANTLLQTPAATGSACLHYAVRGLNALISDACLVMYLCPHARCAPQRDVSYLKKRIAKKAKAEGGTDSNRPNLDPTKGCGQARSRLGLSAGDAPLFSSRHVRTLSAPLHRAAKDSKPQDEHRAL